MRILLVHVELSSFLLYYLYHALRYLSKIKVFGREKSVLIFMLRDESVSATPIGDGTGNRGLPCPTTVSTCWSFWRI